MSELFFPRNLRLTCVPLKKKVPNTCWSYLLWQKVRCRPMMHEESRVLKTSSSASYSVKTAGVADLFETERGTWWSEKFMTWGRLFDSSLKNGNTDSRTQHRTNVSTVTHPHPLLLFSHCQWKILPQLVLPDSYIEVRSASLELDYKGGNAWLIDKAVSFLTQLLCNEGGGIDWVPLILTPLTFLRQKTVERCSCRVLNNTATSGEPQIGIGEWRR